MNGPSAFELQGNERSARVALWSQRYLCFTIALGPSPVARFGSALPSAAGADWLSDLAVRSNSSARDPEFGDQISGGCAEGLPCVGSLHAHNMKEVTCPSLRSRTRTKLAENG